MTHRAIGPTRRSFIAVAAGAALSAAPVRSAFAGSALPPTRQLALRHLHTGEQLRTVYAVRGRYVSAALRHIDHILRDWRTGEVMRIDRGLLDLLARLHLELRSDQPFEVICGYRSAKTNAMLRARGGGGVASRSYHLKGQAIDIRLPDHSLVELCDVALALQAGGVGFYPDLDFIHVDTGPVRRW